MEFGNLRAGTRQRKIDSLQELRSFLIAKHADCGGPGLTKIEQTCLNLYTKKLERFRNKAMRRQTKWLNKQCAATDRLLRKWQARIARQADAF